VLLERERLHQRLLHGTEALVAQLSALGRHADAVEVALSAVAADPLRESAHRAVMAAYVAEGNTVEALRQYQRFAVLLRVELDLAPTADLTQFIEQRVHRRGLPVVTQAVPG
jgi:DNA-binding SARP family transcriptional activator